MGLRRWKTAHEQMCSMFCHYQLPIDFVKKIVRNLRYHKKKVHNYGILFANNDHTPVRSGSAWKEYVNARVADLFLLVLLEYPNGKGVVRDTSRGLDMAPHWLRVGAAPLMSLRQDETSEPLLYARRMVGPYRCKDAMQGRNDDPVTSGIRARLDREAESFKLFSLKVLKSVGCAKVAGVISRDIEESI
nr:hypothetical protein [Tanacetum cinerariifolium]